MLSSMLINIPACGVTSLVPRLNILRNRFDSRSLRFRIDSVSPQKLFSRIRSVFRLLKLLLDLSWPVSTFGRSFQAIPSLLSNLSATKEHPTNHHTVIISFKERKEWLNKLSCDWTWQPYPIKMSIIMNLMTKYLAYGRFWNDSPILIILASVLPLSFLFHKFLS